MRRIAEPAAAERAEHIDADQRVSCQMPFDARAIFAPGIGRICRVEADAEGRDRQTRMRVERPRHGA